MESLRNVPRVSESSSDRQDLKSGSMIQCQAASEWTASKGVLLQNRERKLLEIE